MYMNGEKNNGNNEEKWRRHQSAPVDDGWGWIRSTNGSGKPLKTKGSSSYTRRTLSCDNPTDPPRIEVPSLVVLAAKQVAAHTLDQENLKLAPLHANLIHGMGIKREREKGKSEWSPTPVQ